MARDNEIISLYSTNCREAQLLLLGSYRNGVQRVIGSVVPDCQDVEELTQDTFLRVFDNIHLFDSDRGSLANWIYRIAYRMALSFVSKRSRFTIPLDEAPPDALAVSDAQVDEGLSSGRTEQIEALERAVGALPPEERLMINLYYYEGYAIADVAEIFDLSPNATYHRLSNIRKKLGCMIMSES